MKKLIIIVSFLGPFFLNSHEMISEKETLSNEIKNEFLLLVHKTPTCGCCKMWMKHVEEDGFTAYGQDHQNLMKIKEKYMRVGAYSLIGFGIFYILRKRPRFNITPSFVSTATEVIKNLPIDRHASDILTPLIDFTTTPKISSVAFLISVFVASLLTLKT